MFQVLKDRFLALVSTFKWWFPHPDDRRRKSVGAQNHIDDLVQHVAVSNAAFSDDSYIDVDTLVPTEEGVDSQTMQVPSILQWESEFPIKVKPFSSRVTQSTNLFGQSREWIHYCLLLRP